MWNFRPVPSFGGIVRRTSSRESRHLPRTAPRLATPTDLGANAAKDIAGALNGILADTFALDDNQRVVGSMREAHDVCDEHSDVASASLLETFIDDAEKRVWFL